MSAINIFVSFDLDHDADLYDLLLEQSENATLGFEVSGRSEAPTLKDPEGAGLRRRIREADQVIVIRSEHTDVSAGVFAELRIAQEEQKPYLLLWGRRDSMCTKPAGAKPREGMYSWTSQTLQEQITLMARKAHWETPTEDGSLRTDRKWGSSSRSAAAAGDRDLGPAGSAEPLVPSPPPPATPSTRSDRSKK